MAIFDFFRNMFAAEKRAGNFIDPKTYSALGGSGITVNKDTALTFSAVWAAIRILSESVGQLPIQLCERKENGDKVIRSDHFLYNIIHNKPNEYMTNCIFLEKIMYDLCVSGNSYVRIQRNGAGRPIGLYPLLFSDVEVKEYEDQYFYYDKNTGDALEYEEILHFKIMSQDGMIGTSPIDTCANSISWGLGLEQYGNSYFSNGAKVSGVLQTDRALSTEAVDRLRNSFDLNYSQIGDANKTLILEEGLKFNTISLSNEASQFLSSRQFSIEEIARIFNIPPHLLRDLSKSSFSNIQEQSREFVQYSLMPYLVMIEQEMTTKLFKKKEQGKLYIEFNTNALLRGNPKERAEYYRTMLNIGAMSINEIRQKENMNMVEEGDNLFMQLNMATLETIVKGGTLQSGDDEVPVEEPTEEIDVEVDVEEEEVKTNGVLKH
tara:strand:- start:22424 stop:23725 length:1302 start_codon:yes stop_codon:yes gene_type:complete